MLESIDAIERFVAGRTFEQYASDHLLRSGVERQFDIIGEAARRLRDRDPSTFRACPDLANAIDFRNFLTHVYDKIDDTKVWDTIVEKLPLLKRQVSQAFDIAG